MAVSYFEVPFNIADMGVEGPVDLVRVFVGVNAPDGVVAYPDDNFIFTSGSVFTFEGGTGTLKLPTLTGATLSQFEYVLVFEAQQTGLRARAQKGPFYQPAPTSTAAIPLAQWVATGSAPATWMTQATQQLEAAAQSALASTLEAKDQAVAARDATAVDRAYVENLVVTDLGTTDGQTKALIESPSSQTAAALNNAIAKAPAPRRTAAGETLAAALETGIGVKTVAVFGDSTGNDLGAWAEWPEWLLRAIYARFPSVHVERSVWDHAGENYPAPTVLNASTNFTPPSPGGPTTVMADTFARTVANLQGTTPDTGPAWVGASNWSADGTKAIRNSASTAPLVTAALPTGDTTITWDDVTVSTVAGAAGNLSFLFRSNTAYDRYLELRITVGADGAVGWSFIKVASGSTVLTSAALPALANNAAGQTFDLVLSTSGRDLTATLGASTLTHTLTVEDHALFTSGAFGLFSAQRFSGMTIGGVSAVVNVAPVPASGSGVLMWNGSVPGSTLAYQTPRLNAMLPTDTDVVFLNSSHNYGLTMTAAAYAEAVDTFVTAALARAPQAKIVVTSQNPEFVGTWTQAHVDAQRARMAALRALAAEKGWGYIPAFEAFAAQPDGGQSLVQGDGIHPTQAGSEFWGEVAARWLGWHFYE